MMNERIKELQFQAAAQVNPLLEGSEWQRVFVEKFAELIIKDCASICELNGKSYKYSFTPMKARLAESTSTHCSELIKKHFGVE